MLRDFQYNAYQSQLLEILEKFGFDIKDGESPINLLRFEVISPDTFMWRISVKGFIYYLYAEDYVNGLESIKSIFTAYLHTAEWELIESSDKKLFQDSSPILAATTYVEPEDSGELMRYAVESGYDFVFLAKSQEDPANANFSDYAPRGLAGI